MNRLAFSAALLALAACSQASNQPQGKDETRTYELKDFDRVSAKAGVELILKQGPFAVEASSRDGDLSKLVIGVDGSELSISREVTLGKVEISPHYTITATAPIWAAIEGLAGASIDGENLNLDAVIVRASAGANIELSGTCREIMVEATAGSSIDADDLKCVAAIADASAGAKVDLHATERARGAASAGATIEISGKPPTFDHEADISSTVKLE
jgi:hypothetical protein